MAAIEVENLKKAFGPSVAVADVSFQVEPGNILVIVGASGCGKTTTLRCIAGLERPTSGQIRVLGKTVASDSIFVPPEHRGIGMMFQSYALWPHMTVHENIAYGLVIKRMPAAAIRKAIERVIALVGLGGLEQRYPSDLSGGQQQRVALARSAVTEPKILLLDEPLSNLDAKLRDQMRGDLRRLIKTLQITAVHITHDQTEAMAIADQLIFMRNGRIEQAGTPRELYNLPANRFVADFIGSANFFDAARVHEEDGEVLVRLADGIALWARPAGSRPPDEMTVAIRPESVVLSTTRPEGRNTLSGEIVEEMFLGNYAEYRVRVGDLLLTSHERGVFPLGSPVFVTIAPQAVLCLAREA